ncbi:GNAT family N-acetyltransferase [Paenacidovorax monticola]|uniref:GNAT family N-acetyltransferase n=1 Tax=Paenacidovorax monticola TaxID=1926868 RepID=A0A7H0HKE5_9BURK|nr:GNAT family N-acetyltransferase [Paenacidovorax monticola]QNP61011.1 GNAT family N-acetyltransferase [Paenacidovorax monticola]
MNIRTATPDDAEAISALIHLSAHHFVADPGAAVPARFLEGIAVPAIHSRIADPAFRYLIAEEGGALAGAIALQDGRHLYHLFVAAPFRGRGWRALSGGPCARALRQTCGRSRSTRA